MEMGRIKTLEPAVNPHNGQYLQANAQSPMVSMSAQSAASDGFPFTGVNVSGSDLEHLANLPFTVPPVVKNVDTQIGPMVSMSSDNNDMYDKEIAVTPMVSVCEACNKKGPGKIDNTDDSFYCFNCWKQWSGPNDKDGKNEDADGDEEAPGFNDDLYKKASSITAGN